MRASILRHPLVAFYKLRRWEIETAQWSAGRPSSWLDIAFSRMNPSQMGIIFICIVMFGLDLVIALSSGVGGVTGMRREMVAEAAQTKYDTLQKKQMVLDYARKNRDGKGFVVSEHANQT